MRVTALVRASHVHKPLINFIGKRSWGTFHPFSFYPLSFLAEEFVAAVESHEPQPHPQAPNNQLPKPVTDFKRYRANAQQHGPLARAGHFPSRQASANNADVDVVFDRDELPARFRRMIFSPDEMEAINVTQPIGEIANFLERRSNFDLVD